MPGPSQVSIWNLALSHVAQKPVVAITDTSPQALACARVWDISLKDALRASKPGFARAIVALALHATYVPLHWTYAYAYPANAVSMNLVYNEATQDPTVGEQFRELYIPASNEKVIVTNCESAYGEYTYNIIDTTLFDPSFVTALALKLASNLAVPLVGDRAMADSLDKKFIIAASECDRHNSYEQNTQPNQQSTFHKAR